VRIFIKISSREVNDDEGINLEEMKACGVLP
jgi:hypothetical protein